MAGSESGSDGSTVPWTRALARAVGLGGLFVAAAGLVTVQLWSEPGWPWNHEGDVFAARTQVYAAHMLEADFLPIWSSADNAGFGSPQPALYHKLFYLVSGLARWAGLSMKGALVVAVISFLAVGAGGMYRLLRELGAARHLAICAGLLLLLANYTTTNWLIRGALAELSAAMLVPWLLWGLVKTVRTSCLSLALPVSLGLLVWAHPVLAFFLVLISAIPVAVGLLTGRIQPTIVRPRRLALAATLVLVISAPVILTMQLMGTGYDLGRLATPFYAPRNNFAPPTDYLIDGDWRWGKSVQGVTVQLEWPILIVLAAATLVLARRRWVTRHSPGSDVPMNPMIWTLMLLSGFSVLLQLRISTPFYDLVPGAEFLQFPWRLLAVLTPALVALALALLVQVAPPRATLGIALACIVGGAALGGAFAPISYDRIALRGASAELGLYGEYVPTTWESTKPPDRQRLEDWQRAHGCSVESLSLAQEALSLTFEAECRSPATVPLPHFSNPLHRISVGSRSGTSDCADVPAWPGLCEVQLTEGRHLIRLDIATWRTIFDKLLPG